MSHPLAEDLDGILAHTESIWPGLRGARFFLTGGTGFIGTWMIESLLWAEGRHHLGLDLIVLTRDAAAFQRKAPHLAAREGLRFHSGDIRNFEFPAGEFSHVVHAATAASAHLNLEQPLEMLSTIVGGAERTFEFASACGARTVLHTSTGGVYGAQPPEMTHIAEEYLGAPAPLDAKAAYSEGKRLAEMIGSIRSRKHGFGHKVARISALVGPHLPLDTHFALGNFLGDALQGRPIRIKGDGSPVRSYLYAADLVAWLWIIMEKGESNRPYNAGSEQGMSLLEAAEAVSRVHGGGLPVEVARQDIRDGRPGRYVLSTQRAQTELGVRQWTNFEAALRKTLDWHQQTGG